MTARPTSIVMALEAALASAFLADTALSALVRGRIHDGSPRGAVLPYLAFADVACDDFSSGDGAGARVALTLEAVTDDGDRRRALMILDAALERTLAAEPSLAAGVAVLVTVRETRVGRTDDGKGWRASAVLDVLVDA